MTFTKFSVKATALTTLLVSKEFWFPKIFITKSTV